MILGTRQHAKVEKNPSSERMGELLIVGSEIINLLISGLDYF